MDQVRYDQVWRRIRRDAYTDKFEGRFGHRFHRLERLVNWGALAWLYPHATATKQAHHLGLEHNAARFLARNAARSRHRPALRTAAHVLHWGHPPLSYQGAEALLRAGHVEPRIATVLSHVIDAVISFGSLDCRSDGHGGRCADAVLSGERPFELYRWLAAWTVSEDWSRVWQAIRDAEAQVGGEAPDESETKRKLTRTLVCHEDRGFAVLHGCNLADYVPRDLLQCGTAWLSLDPDVLWDEDPLGRKAAREWTLIHSARTYLQERFYATPSSLLIHTLTARAIAGDLVGRTFGVKELRRLLESDLGDEFFDINLRPYHRDRIRGLQQAARQNFERVWRPVGVFRSVSLPTGRLFAEDFLTGRTGRGRLSFPFNNDYSVFAESSEDTGIHAQMAGPARRYYDVYCHHRTHGHPQMVRAVLDVLAKVSDWIRRPNGHQVGDGLLSWILDAQIEQRTAAIERVLTDLIQADADYFRTRVRRLTERSSLVEFNRHNDVLFWADFFTDPDFAQFAPPPGFLLRLPWRATRMNDGAEILSRIREKALKVANDSNAPDRGAALELAVATDQLLTEDDCVHRQLILNPTELSETREPLTEWDVIRIDLLRNGNWSMSAVECSINLTSAKESRGREKLEVLRAALQGASADLAEYETWFATLGDDRPTYEDAGRSYTRTTS